MAQLISNTIPVRALGDHQDRVIAVAVFPDRQRMVTGSHDAMLHLWDMRQGIVLKKMEGHSSAVNALAISRDGQLVASGDANGQLIPWDGDTGDSLTQPIKAHSSHILSLDFSPDGTVLATGSHDHTTLLWNTATWQLQGNPITCGVVVHCVRYSPSGELLAIAGDHIIEIYNPDTQDRITSFEGRAATSGALNSSLAWTPDGTRLFSSGSGADPTIREWDSSTWQQVGGPWKGHFKTIHAICLNSNGALLASASHDNRVRLWRLSDRRTIAIFRHSGEANCVTFSADDRHILSGGEDKKISEWLVSEDALPQDVPQDGSEEQEPPQAQAYSDFKVLAINSRARQLCIDGDLTRAEKVLSQEIDADANNYTSYANRAFVRARKGNWDTALYDAIKSVNIQPSFAGHIAKGIVLYGKRQALAARSAFDFASMYTNGDLKASHFLFLIKTIVLFNENEHVEAMLRLEELAMCSNANPLACRIVEAYLRVQLGNSALDDRRYNEAVDHFAAAVNASAFFYKLDIHSMYEEFTMLFGWDLKSLWKTANQQQCRALFRAGRMGAAIELYQSFIDKSGRNTSLGDWYADIQ